MLMIHIRELSKKPKAMASLINEFQNLLSNSG